MTEATPKTMAPTVSASVDGEASVKKPDLSTLSSDIIENTVVEEFGYEVSYSRVFRSIGSMSLSMAMASPLCGITVTSAYQYTYGGYWGLSWGWLLPSVLFLPWALTTAEFCSSMPVNGSYYWWTAALAPPSISRPISFIAGMANVLSAVTSVASFAWACASSIAMLISLLTGWVPTSGVMFGMAIGTCILWYLMASIRMDRASQVYITTATVVLITTLCFYIGLPASHAAQGRPFVSASKVFGEYVNNSDWGNSVAVPFTWFTVAWVVTGWNAPAAVAEETHNARIVAPRAIVSTYALMALLGAVVCLLLAFCTNDITAAATDESGYPAFTVIIDHWGLKIGVAFLLVIFCTTLVGGAAALVMQSSLVAAFARDGGLIYNDKLSYISPRSNMPVHTVQLLTVGGMLVLCLGFSPIASQIIFSLAVIALMILYALPMIFRIFDQGRWAAGPWNYGRLSRPIHIFGFVTVCYMTIMECFPPSANWTWSTLNWSWAVVLGAILISTILWFARGRKHYKGPDQEALAIWRTRSQAGLHHS